MEKNISTIIKTGGIGVFPTDTIYGIIGSAFSKRAVKRIYSVKGRDENKPFIILISQTSDLKKFAINPTLIRANKRILEKFWPGPVSVILPCPEKKFEYLHRGTKSLAFRFPAKKNKKLLALLAKTGPLVAPSANPQGLPPAETIVQAKRYFADKVDFYVSAGTKKGKPSQVISLLFGDPKIIRR